MNPYHHALSSVARYGGTVREYIKIHEWFDYSKRSWADPRHRALRHHSEGIFDCQDKFGHAIKTSVGTVPVRYIGEDHVREDLGFIPTMRQWFEPIKMEKWMLITMQPDKDVHDLLMKGIPTELKKSR